MLQAIQTLSAGIEAGVIDGSEWRAWAERAILKESNPNWWLADLIVAFEPDEALTALGEGRRHYRDEEPGADETSLFVGFLFERFVSGGATLRHTLDHIGRVLDGRNYNDPSCEAVFLLINELDAAGTVEPAVEAVVTKANALLGFHLDAARKARQLL